MSPTTELRRILAAALATAALAGAATSISGAQSVPADPGPPSQVWNFETSLLPLTGCLARGLACAGLEGWDIPQWPELANGQTRVVEPGPYRVPPRPGGTNGHVLRASVSSRQRARGQYAAYLYKIWAVGPPETGWSSALTGVPLERIRRGDEAGIYRAWYFIPASTRRTLRRNRAHGWVNIFQFKRSQPNGQGRGRWAQPPEWWVNIRNSSANRLTLCVSHWRHPSFCERRGLRSRNLPRVPFGRWFSLRADVRPYQRIDFYLDGRRFETGRVRDYPVGLQSRDSSWVFAPGWYLNTGTAFIDDVSFEPRPDW